MEMLSVIFHLYNERGEADCIPRGVKEELLSIYESVHEEWPHDLLNAVEKFPEVALETIYSSLPSDDEFIDHGLYSSAYNCVATNIVNRYLCSHLGKSYIYTKLERLEYICNVVQRLVNGNVCLDDSSYDDIFSGGDELFGYIQELADNEVAVFAVVTSWLYENKTLLNLLRQGAIEAVISLADVNGDVQMGMPNNLIIISKKNNARVKFYDLTSLTEPDALLQIFDTIQESNNKYVCEIQPSVIYEHNTFDAYYYFTDILFDSNTILISDIAKEIETCEEYFDEYGHENDSALIDNAHKGFTDYFPIIQSQAQFESFIHSGCQFDGTTRSRYICNRPAVLYTDKSNVARYNPPAVYDDYYEIGKFMDIPIFSDAAALTTRVDGSSFLSQIGYKEDYMYKIRRIGSYTIPPFNSEHDTVAYPSNDYLISVLLDAQTKRQVNILKRKYDYDSNIIKGESFTKGMLNFKVKKRDSNQIREYIEQTKNPNHLAVKSNTCNIIVIGGNIPIIKEAITFNGDLDIVECLREEDLELKLRSRHSDFHAILINVTDQQFYSFKGYAKQASNKGIPFCFITFNRQQWADARCDDDVTEETETKCISFRKDNISGTLYLLDGSGQQDMLSDFVEESTHSSRENEIRRLSGDVLALIDKNLRGYYGEYKEIIGSILYPDKYEIKNSSTYFTKFRSIVEAIFISMKDFKYLPDNFVKVINGKSIINMSDAYKYLTGQLTGEKAGYVQYGKKRTSVFPHSIGAIIKLLIDVGNHGSHNDDYINEVCDDKLDEYLEDIKNSLPLIQGMALLLGPLIKFVYSEDAKDKRGTPETPFSLKNLANKTDKAYKASKGELPLMFQNGTPCVKIDDVLVKVKTKKSKENTKISLKQIKVNTDNHDNIDFPLYAFDDN